MISHSGDGIRYSIVVPMFNVGRNGGRASSQMKSRPLFAVDKHTGLDRTARYLTGRNAPEPQAAPAVSQ